MKRVKHLTPTLTGLFALSLLAQPTYAQSASLQWTLAVASKLAPTGRVDAPIAYDPAAKLIYMFGGYDATGDRDDLWSYSSDRSEWTRLSPTNQGPKARHGHTVTFDPIRRRVVVIAGQAGVFYSDAWAYDPQSNAWTQLAAANSGPSARYGHSAIYDVKRDRIVLSHGFTDAGRFDDTWALDLATNQWRNISPSGTRPLKRCLHHAGYSAATDEMFLYGGCSSGFGPCPQGDLWSLNLATNQWREVTGGQFPPARERYGMVFDDTRGKLVLYGGLGSGILNDIWEFDPTTRGWSQVSALGNAPAGRYRHEAVYASNLQTAYFFGGQASDYLNDLLQLAPTAVGIAVPRITAGGVASVFGTVGPVSPGEIVAVYGSGLGPQNAVSASFDPTSLKLPLVLGGTSVTVNGIAAPLFFVSAAQVDVQIPYEVAGQGKANIVVTYQNLSGSPETVDVASAAPSLWVGALNQDGALNSPARPASAGDIVTFFATGQGATVPPGVTGQAAAAPYPVPAGPVRVTIAGREAGILFAGLAPGTAGLLQINVRVPAGVTANPSAPVSLSIGEATSPKGVTIAIE